MVARIRNIRAVVQPQATIANLGASLRQGRSTVTLTSATLGEGCSDETSER